MSRIKNLKKVIIRIFALAADSCFSFKELKEKVKEIVNRENINVRRLKRTLKKLLKDRQIYKKRTLKGVVIYCLLIGPIPGPRSTIISAKIGTTGKIIRSPTHSLPLMKLKEDMKKKLKKDMKTIEEILIRALQELNNEWGIRRVETSKGEYCSLPEYNIKSAKTGYKLYNIIDKAEKALTAKKLAEKVHLDPSYVFKICRRLKNGGYIKRGYSERHRRFFAPLTGETVHSGNYNRVKALNQELIDIVSKFSLKDPRLKQGLQSSLENMLEREDLTKFSKSIETFKKDFLKKVSQAKTKSEVHGLLGFRPFPQFVTTWKKPPE